MFTIIETERLKLRAFKVEDAKALFELNENINVIQYTGDPPFESISAARNFVKNYDDYRKNGFGRWAVIRKADGAFIGWCGLKLNEQNLIDIGFRFFEHEWSKGYATEAAKACLNYGFNVLNIDEIIGRAAIENKASIRVLEKLNMVFWKSDTCKGIQAANYYRIQRTDFNSTANPTAF